MLHLYDLNKVKIKGLKLYKDYCIESTLSTGDKVLSFLYPSRLAKEVMEECYIRTKKDEFVIKETADKGDWKSVKAILNVEDLEGQVFEHFNTTEQTIEQCLTLAVAGTGWTVQVNGVTKRRTIRKTNCSTWEIIQQAKKTYLVEIEFDTISKVIKIADKLGSDKGVYFMDSLNLRSLDIQSNSYEFYTRLIAIGKNDLKVTVENFHYSNKRKTLIWKDERYTDINALTEDATAKLAEISKPYRAFGADIIDLANMSDKYSVLSYSLGDIITLISKEKNIKEKQRIVKIVQYPEEPERNSCEIANTIVTFADIQKEYQEAAETVNNITSDNGTISEGAIKVAVEQITINKADIQALNAVSSRIGTLEVTTATITQLNAEKARIDNLISTTATITQLNATNAKIVVLESKAASIDTLVAGNLSAANMQAGFITAESGLIANGAIKDAMILNLSVSKILAGDISTSKFRIVSDSGNIIISDNTIQIKDSTRVRVQIGKDASNDYNMYVWDALGNLMFDATGLKASGIKSKIIRDDMVSDTANINGTKLNINSVVSSINGATTLLKASKINLDTEAQILDVAFTSLKSTVTSTSSTVSSQGTAISVMQGQISSKIWQQDITNSISPIGSKVSTLENNYSSLNQTVNNIAATINSVQTTVNDLGTRVSTTESSINLLQTQITLKVESTTFNNTVSTINTNVTTAETNAKSYADIKKTEAIGAASTDATTKANNAKTGAITDSKTYTDGQITTVNSTLNSKVAEIKATTDSITSRVGTTESNITTINGNITSLQNRVTTAEQKITDTAIINIVTSSTSWSNQNTQIINAQELARAMSTGKMIHLDPMFKNGLNNCSVYNNAGNGVVTLTRIAKPSDCPTTSTHCLEIKITGAGSPGWGGFYQGIQARAGAKFVVKLIAKIPVGYKLNLASNSMGSGYSDKIITSADGTGKFEEYIRVVTCGITGTFSSGGHFYLSGGSTPTATTPLLCQIAYCTVFDITDGDYTLVDTQTTANTALSNANTANTNIGALTTRVSSAESKLTPSALTTTIKNELIDKGGVNKVVTSISNFDDKGLTVEHSDSGTRTMMTSEGFSVLKSDGTPLASFGMANSTPTLNVTDITSPSILKVVNPSMWSGVKTVYVSEGGSGDRTGRDVNNKCGSVETAIRNALNGCMVLNNGQDLIVEVAGGSYSQYCIIWDVRGAGTIRINLAPTVVWNGMFNFTNNEVTILIKGNRTGINSNDGAMINPSDVSGGVGVWANKCKLVWVDGIRSVLTRKPNTWPNFFGVTGATNAIFTNSDISNYQSPISVDMVSRAYMDNCRGSNNDIVGIAYSGSYLGVNGQMPANGSFAENYGGLVVQTNTVQTTSCNPALAPTFVDATQTQTFSAISYRSIRSDWDNPGLFAQSGWSPYAPWTGYAYFSNIKSWTDGRKSGATVSGQIFLQRKSTSHGVSGPVVINLYGIRNSDGALISYGSPCSLSRGSSGWFSANSLATDIASGYIRETVVIKGSGDSQYAILENNCQLYISTTFSVRA